MKLSKLEGSCAPCALQYLSKKKDIDVLEACIAQGMNDEDWIAAGAELGIKLRKVEIEPMEVRKFLRTYPTGTYLVGTYDHLFVIENGVQVDPRNPKPPGLRRTIKQAWKVISEKSKTAFDCIP